MSSRSTEQQQETDARRFIFGIYARSFSPPRIQKLADLLIGLDRLGACRLANEIDQVIGSVASEKLLSQLDCCRERDHEKEGRQREKKG